ncbi:MAG: hypothetical protein N2246_08280 [Candidatus Sumerlaeia bacterium]|nr:hypothetical protein [Candidatus Sumerlaeia bacterium]
MLPFQVVEGDVGPSWWNFWWAKHALFSLRNPYHCDYLFYPWGISLIFHGLNLLTSILTLPFQFLGGIAFCYNLVIALSFLLTLLTTYWLVQELTTALPQFPLQLSDKPSPINFGALIASLITATAPYRFEQLHHLLYIPTFGVTLWIIFFCRSLNSRRNSWWDGVGLGLVSGGLILVNWHFVVYCIWFALFYLIYLTLTQPGWVRHLPSRRNLFLAVILMLPIVVFILREIAVAVRQGLSPTFDIGPKVFWSADLLNYFVPPFLLKKIINATQPGFWGVKVGSEFAIFPGMVLWALLLLAWFNKQPKPLSRYWLTLALLFAILSLGPVLKIYRPIKISEKFFFYLPGYYLLKVPLLGEIKHLTHYGYMVIFCLAIFIGINYPIILQRIRKIIKLSPSQLFLILAVLILIENGGKNE